MIETDIAAVRAGRGTPDQQMTVVSVLDALLRPSGHPPKGNVGPMPIEGRKSCDVKCNCESGWCAAEAKWT